MKNQAVIHYGGYAVSAVGALFGVSFLSHIVPVEIYGKIALYIAIATLFQSLVRESLSNALMRHALEIRQNKNVALILVKNTQGPLLICFISICLFCLFWMNAHDYKEIILSFLLIALLGISVAGEAFLSAILKRGAYAIHLNTIQWLRFPLAGVFYIYFNQTASSVLFGFVLVFAIAISFDYAVWKSMKSPQERLDNDSSDLDIFKGWTSIFIGFFVWFTTFYDRIAIETIHGENILGIYFVLIQIAYMPVVVFMRASANFIFPLLYNSDRGVIDKKIVGAVGTLIFCGWMFLLFMHQWIFSWLVGEAYRGYSWLLPWLFLAAVLNAISYLFQAFFYQKYTIKILLLVKGVTAFFFFCLASLFIWRFEIQGAVFANVSISILLLTLSVGFGGNISRACLKQDK